MTKKAVMTRAWEIRRAENTTMSVSLKKAWAEAKTPYRKQRVVTTFRRVYFVDDQMFMVNLLDKSGKKVSFEDFRANCKSKGHDAMLTGSYIYNN